MGFFGIIGFFVNYGFIVYIFWKVIFVFGWMVVIIVCLEGNYWVGLLRVGWDVEEVVFYNGGKRERGILEGMYRKLKEYV